MLNLAIRNLDRSSPWSVLRNWTRDFDQRFNEMDGMLLPFRSAVTGASSLGLACDIHETDSNYLLSLDIPGVSKDDINIEFAGSHVTVTAERKPEHSVKDATAHRVERSYGSMQRSFVLPDGIDSEKIQASFENGVLYLAIPKEEVAKPKRIEINAGKSGFLQKIKEKTLDSLDTKAKVASK